MRKFHLATLVMIILLLSGSAANAQDFSNKGKEFWLAYSYHVGMVNTGGSPVMTLYLTSDVSTTYNVEIYGSGNIETGTINAGQVKTVVIPNAYFINNDGLFTNRAIRVTAAKPIVVYSYITRSAASGATLCLPTAVLGREYVSMNYKQLSNEANSNSYITIVAVEDNTNVEITVTAKTKGNWQANTTHTVSLNKGQIYQVLGETAGNNGEDLTGSVVRSVASSGGGCKKIAVFSGSGKISIGCVGGSSDNLYQQLYPVASWGKKYLTIPSYNRPNAIYRIAKSDPVAKVFLNGVLIPSGSFTNNVYEFTNTTPNQIESDQPICVAQYFTTQGCAGNGSPYDPDMIILNPLEQNIDKVTLVSSNLVATASRQHHLHVIIKNSGTALSSFKLDGNPVPTTQWVTHPANPAYSYIYFSNVAQGYHTLASDTGFNALAYGYADAETYGYSAGSSIKDLYQFISIDNQYAQVNIPATCKNMPFSLSMTFPYEPTQIIWQFNGLYPDVTINSPVYDESNVVNGKTLYKYKLTGSYTAPGAGSYPIKIIAQNPTPDGCSGVQEIEYDLQVFDPPVADFNFTSSGCISIPVNFTDNSTNPSGRTIIHRYWDFGDGATQTGVASPAHTYSAPSGPDPYLVKYTIITDVGCKSVDTAKHTVALNNSPVANFTVTAPVCIGKAITFKDASTGTGISKWVWNFGDGPDVIATTNADQVHTFSGSGPYRVTLKVITASGCESVVADQQVTLNPNPVVDFTLPAVCVTKVAAFNSTSTISDGTESQFTYAWDFGDASPVGAGQSPSHTYANPGPFDVKLTVTSNNGCISSLTKPLTTIYPAPAAAFTVPADACVGGAINFTDGSTVTGGSITEWHWDFGDMTSSTTQNPSKTYITSGIYTVTLSVKSAQGCESAVAASHPVDVKAPPTAAFTVAAPYCAGKTIVFTDASSGTGISKWTWNFGDGSPVVTATTNANQTHTYTGTGPFIVTLDVETASGCRGTSTKPITVNPEPAVSFTLPTACISAGPGAFNSTSTISDGTESQFTYTWDFGDGSPVGSGQSPSHTYSNTGPFNVKLTVTSNNGCAAELTKPLTTIYAEPVAAFTAPAEVCAGTAVTFTDESTVSGSTITGWQWDFGDMTSSTDKNPVKTYNTPGSYIVKLTVTSAQGCRSITTFVTHPITVNTLPVADFNVVLPGCVNQAITLNDASSGNGGLLVKWSWDFGDGNTAVASTNAPATHTYTSVGSFTATLQVETDKGCKNTAAPENIVVNPLPAATFTPPVICVTDRAAFSDASTVPSGSIASWQWNFGDATFSTPGNPNTSAAQNPSHQYSQPGDYTVQLTVTSNAGCQHTVSHPFTVNSPAVSAFTIENTGPDAFCSNKQVTIKDASRIDAGSIIRVEIFWDETGDLTNKTVDNSPAIGKVYTHTYPEFGSPATKTYRIRYDVYSGITCVSSVRDQVTLLATPTLTFATLDAVCSIVPAFDISTKVQLLNGLSGAGTFSGSGVSPAGIFTPSGAPTGSNMLTYTYTADNGCISTVQQPLVVNPTPIANAGPDRVVLEGGIVTLTPTLITNIPVTYTWTPSTGLSNPAIATPGASPVADQLYTLTVTSDKGCTTSDNVFVKLLLAPVIPNIFSPNGDGIHDRWVIEFLDSYPGCVVQIFNRYGQPVYRIVNYTTPWDGKVSGKDVPVGTYYYIIDPKNGRKPITGYIDIIR